MRRAMMIVLMAAACMIAASAAMASEPAAEAQADSTKDGAGIVLAQADSNAAPHMRPGGAKGKRRGPISEAEQAEALEFLRNRMPAQYERLEKLREEKPRHYRRELRQVYKLYRWWKEMPAKMREPTMRVRKARFKASRLVRKLRKTEDLAETEKLQGELKLAVAEHFDAEQKLQVIRLEMLKEKIELMDARLDQRGRQREQIIEKRTKLWLAGKGDGKHDGPGRLDGPGRRGKGEGRLDGPGRRGKGGRSPGLGRGMKGMGGGMGDGMGRPKAPRSPAEHDGDGHDED